jgi:hypothetical protein
VPPLQARKMTARVQAATTSGRPVVLLYDTKAGHAGGRPVGKVVDDLSLQLAFLAGELGMEGLGITERGRPSVKLGASEESAGISLAGPTGTSNTYVILEAKASSSSLKLRNEDGRSRWSSPSPSGRPHGPRSRISFAQTGPSGSTGSRPGSRGGGRWPIPIWVISWRPSWTP